MLHDQETYLFFLSSRRRLPRFDCDWSSDVCASDLVALLQHLERVEELLPKHILAPPVVALGGKHGEGVLRQLVAAERGLAPPDRKQNAARHAEDRKSVV